MIQLPRPLLTLLLASLALCVTAVAKPKKPKKPGPPPDIKALLITGGCCHDYGNQQELIPASIDLHTGLFIEWTIFHQRSEDTTRKIDVYENPDWAKPYDIVVHNECFANVGDVDFIDRILQPHLDGVPAVLIHCSMHSYRSGPTAEKWWEFCGVHSPRHGAKHPFEVEITASEHEVMKGMDNWTTPNGELYFIEKIYPTATPLAESKSEAKGSVYTNIWVNAYGPNQTRVFGTTIGHHNETMLQPQYMEMISRGFLWAAGKSVSDNLILKDNSQTSLLP